METELTLQDVTRRAKTRQIPISVLVEVCYTCNLQCRHCFLEERHTRGLTLQQYEAIFDQLVKAGTLFVILTGGEPFTRRDFMDIVRAARRRRLSVTIFTNGTLLNDSIISELKRLYVQEVHISVYGPDASSPDSITNVPGSFQRTVGSIKLLLAAGMRVRIKSPLMSQTATKYIELKRFAKDLGVPIQFTTVITAKNNGDATTHSLRLEQSQLETLVKDADVNEIGTAPVHFIDNLDCIPCEVVLNGGTIDPHGEVFACNQLRIPFGNVTQQEFGEIWANSPILNELRRVSLRDLPACKECDLFTFCTRCPGLAHLEDSDLFGCSSAARTIAEVRAACRIYPTQKHIFSKIE